MTLLATSTVALLRRTCDTLRAHLGDALIECAIPGVVVQAPQHDAYYLLGELIQDAIFARQVSIIVEQAGASTLEEYQSGSTTWHKARRITPLRVRAVWTQLAHEPLTLPEDSRALLTPEYLQLVAEVYKGAIITAIFRDLPSADLVQVVELTSDFSSVELEREGYLAVALTEWRITSTVEVPSPRRMTDPTAP